MSQKYISNLGNEDEVVSQSRRNLIKQAACVGASVAGVGANSVVNIASAEQVTAPVVEKISVREAFETLTAKESEVLDAIVSRILPSDENGPGAHEARVVHFIDKVLAGPQANLRETYASAVEALDMYCHATKSNSFQNLSADEQDYILNAMQTGSIFSGISGSFFSLIRNHTIEGAFSDPYYGGNRDFIGWDMLGYPGVRMGSTPEDVRMGADLSPSRQSAYDMPPYTKDPAREVSTSVGGGEHGS